MTRLAVALLWGALLASPSFAADDTASTDGTGIECTQSWPLTARENLGSIRIGGRDPSVYETRHGTVDEMGNVQVIFDVFTSKGYSPAIAYAAIVNAWYESRLNNFARMDDHFVYKTRQYPNGTGAIGLFQLLPMQVGAGGPSGRKEGFSRDFLGRRWAGTRRQAERHGVIPDHKGRTFYDATNPRINAERIVLEMERDGGRLVKADQRGASIAELVVLFTQDIERPVSDGWGRVVWADRMWGRDLARTKWPNTWFPDPPVPDVVSEPDAAEVEAECADPSVAEEGPSSNNRLFVANVPTAFWLLPLLFGFMRGRII